MKRFDLRPLMYFVTVAEEKSFTRAAQRLHVSQPSISSQLAQLEAFLGFPLFARTTRRIELTPQAVELLADARAVVDSSQRFQERARTIQLRDEMHVRFGVSPITAFLDVRVNLMAELFRALPGKSIEVVHLSHGDLPDTLVRGGIDISFYIGHSLADEQAYEQLVIDSAPFQLIVPEDDALAQFERIPPDALRGRQVAGFARTYEPVVVDWLKNLIEQHCGAEWVQPLEPHPFALARHAFEHRMPTFSVKWFNQGYPLPPGLVMRSLAVPVIESEISLVRLRREHHRRGVELFWDVARKYIAAQR